MGKYGEFLYGAEQYDSGIRFAKKRFTYKIFDNGTYVTTWSSDVISEPRFTTEINGGPGQLKVRLARTFDNFGEEVDVKINNDVECLIFDLQAKGGMLLFNGYISEYAQILNGGQEFIDVTILPFSAEATRFMLRESDGDTTVPFNSVDPSDIFRGILSRYQADGGSLGSTSSSIEDTNTTVSYTFNTNTVKQGFDKTTQLSPEGWFWSVDPDGTVNFKQKPTTVTHDLSIGQHITSLRPIKRVEGVINRVYFTGGGEPPLFLIFERSGSIDSLGLYAKKITDQRVTDSNTAETISNRFLDELDEVEVRTKVRVMDNNGLVGGKGYDIESIKVGDTLRIKNLNFGTKSETLWDEGIWDVDVWDQTLASVAGNALLVVKVNYRANFVDVEMSSRFPLVAKRIEDINRNLENTQTKDNPSGPS